MKSNTGIDRYFFVPILIPIYRPVRNQSRNAHSRGNSDVARYV
ncbi:MAG: hypothetical protein NZM35_06605 [Chitinophagales bacterium]|nr:hypothetical protein [Chitinophagales bacterium]MDW8420078.1 hypothetical protein [Chitinophagales bacterium]